MYGNDRRLLVRLSCEAFDSAIGRRLSAAHTKKPDESHSITGAPPGGYIGVWMSTQPVGTQNIFAGYSDHIITP